MADKEIFALDRERCVKCGACVRDCAFKALATGEDGYPEMAVPARCMKCQHCLAICPKAAVAFDGKRPEDSQPLDALALPKAAEVENWLRTRRSCRSFRDADPDRAALERIFKALGNSPTGCNARALSFTCFPDCKAMAAFRESFVHAIEQHRDGNHMLPRWLAVPAIRMRKGVEDMFFRGAAGMVIISSDETAPGVTTPIQDVTIAGAYFDLLAQAEGLATCWCGFLKHVQDAVPEILEKTAGIRRTTPFYAVLFGLPAVKYRRTVQRDDYANVIWKQSGN